MKHDTALGMLSTNVLMVLHCLSSSIKIFLKQLFHATDIFFANWWCHYNSKLHSHTAKTKHYDFRRCNADISQPQCHTHIAILSVRPSVRLSVRPRAHKNVGYKISVEYDAHCIILNILKMNILKTQVSYVFTLVLTPSESISESIQRRCIRWSAVIMQACVGSVSAVLLTLMKFDQVDQGLIVRNVGNPKVCEKYQ